MPDQKSQAKIPVKKADGTTVFLTMEEFREYKKKSSETPAAVSSHDPAPQAAPVPPPNISFDEPGEPPKASAPKPTATKPPVAKRIPKKLEQGKVENIEASLPVVQSTETELATTTPVKNIFVDEAKAAAVTDSVPLVELPSSETSPETPVEQEPEEPISELQEEPEEEIEPEKISPPPADFVKPQWKPDDHTSLLEEDVSQEKQILPPPSSPKDNAATILATVKAQFPFAVSKDIEGRFDSLVLSRIRDIRTPLDVEQYAKMSKEQGGLGLEEDQVRLLLAVITAAQKISGSSSPAPSASPSKPQITPVMNPSTPRIPIPIEPPQYSFTPPVKQNVPSGPGGKPMMQDVTMPPTKRRTMGPVDEIESFSLVDFRRLSPKTENAKEILKGKFQSLQEESYVLFLDARDAWHVSPLFKVYQDTVLSSLENKRPLSDTLTQNTNGLTSDELNAIVEINHYLG